MVVSLRRGVARPRAACRFASWSLFRTIIGLAIDSDGPLAMYNFYRRFGSVPPWGWKDAYSGAFLLAITLWQVVWSAALFTLMKLAGEIRGDELTNSDAQGDLWSAAYAHDASFTSLCWLMGTYLTLLGVWNMLVAVLCIFHAIHRACHDGQAQLLTSGYDRLPKESCDEVHLAR